MNNCFPPSYFIGTLEEYENFKKDLRKREIQRRRDEYIKVFHKVPPEDDTQVFDELMNYYLEK